MIWIVVVVASAVCGAAVWEVVRQAFERHLDRTYPAGSLKSDAYKDWDFDRDFGMGDED